MQEFSDEAARRALAACEAQPPCSTITGIRNYTPQPFRATGALVPEGRIDPHLFDVDLRQVRRPALFKRAP